MLPDEQPPANGQPVAVEGPQPAIVITYDPKTHGFGYGLIRADLPHAGIVNCLELIKADMIEQQRTILKAQAAAAAQRGLVGPDGAPLPARLRRGMP